MSVPRPVLVRGGQLRDEFVCPITRELMRDPVIAADGHTYDRGAIEQWLVNHPRSPKTGEVMESMALIKNINLLKLIRDLVQEGGEGLYLYEEDEQQHQDRDTKLPGGYRYALLRQKVLTLKCLGPADSTWNGRSFRVFPNGVLGGRRRPARQTERDHIPFGDATVSRRHFEIIQNEADMRYYIRDMGSAGGTFLRIQEKEKIPVFHGLMFMVGKHQMVVKDSEQSDRDDATHVGISMQSVSRDDQHTVSADPSKEVEEDLNVLEDRDIADFHLMKSEHSCVLECFAPEGTPMQGRMFEVDRKSASLGRKQVNDVSFSQMGDDGVCMGIDSSVSGIHSRIAYDEEEDALLLMDGSKSKPSTNGTWVRLSKMHARSKFFPLRPGIEVLIGTVRFVTSIDEVIVEKDLTEDETLMQYATEVAAMEADGAAQAKRTPKAKSGNKERGRPVEKAEPPKPFRFKNRPKRREVAGIISNEEDGDKGTATPGFEEEFRLRADDRKIQDSPRGTSETDESQDKVVQLSEEYGTDDEMQPTACGDEDADSSCKD